MLRREVVEGQQLVAIFRQAVGRLGILGLPRSQEEIERLIRRQDLRAKLLALFAWPAITHPRLLDFDGPVARSLVDTLNRERTKTFNADYLGLDFSKIRPRVKEINGVWVSKMEQPFLKAIGLYGPNVDRSEMCKLAESFGVANAMLIIYDYGSTPYPVMISADYCIAFPGEVVERFCLDVLHGWRVCKSMIR